MSIKENIFNGTDSTFTLKYTGYTFPTPTRIEFTLNGTTVNSVDNPTYFDTSEFVSDGKLVLQLGDAGYVPADSGKCTIKIFDATNTDGVVYTHPSGPTIVRVKVND